MEIVSSKLMGGLGNMLFQIAATYSVSLRDKKEMICDITDTQSPHKPYTIYIDNIFRNVKFLDNLVNGFESNLSILNQYPAFEFIEGDIRNTETCLQACEGIDFISHQAALGSVPRSMKEPVYFSEVNISGTVNIFKAAVDKGVKQVVYASSSSVYGDEQTLPKQEDKIGNALSPYAVTKRTNELYAKVFSEAYGLKIMGFRYFNIFGPRQDPDGPYAAVIPLFVKGIINKTLVYINGDGEQTRDFTFVENAVQINVKGMLTDNAAAFGKTFNVAIGERFTVNQLYKICRLGIDQKNYIK